LNIDSSAREKRFPVGREVTLAELHRDPYPAFERLRRYEPISWIAALKMWYVVGYEDVRTALLDTSRLTTESAQSTIVDTFGSHILTTEGAMHERYRQALRRPFTPPFIRTHLEAAIAVAATAPANQRLSDDEIKRNLSIVFFGGISTVEALLLNSLWAQFEHPEARHRELHARRRQS
jgi:cytochrome P450